MKECFKCGRELPLECFYKHPRSADGRMNKCKDCTKHDVSLHRVLHPETHKQYELKRGRSPERRAAKQRYERLHRAKYPEKYKARTAVSNAVRDGRLVKPKECECCGRPGKVEAHHDDYDRPLDVKWLCFACHRSFEHGQIVNT